MALAVGVPPPTCRWMPWLAANLRKMRGRWAEDGRKMGGRWGEGRVEEGEGGEGRGKKSVSKQVLNGWEHS